MGKNDIWPKITVIDSEESVVSKGFLKLICGNIFRLNEVRKRAEKAEG